MAELNLRQRKFVQEYLANGGNGAAAARAAGYAADSARTRAWRLLNEDEAVKAELERAHRELADRTDYRAEKAMEELNDVVAFARETKNATAMARAVELRMRMAGLLVDKHEVNVSGSVDIVGALLEGRARAGLPIDNDDDDVLEGEYTEANALPPGEPNGADIFS